MTFLLAAMLQAVSDDALQLIHDAIANHGYLVAGLAAVLFLVPVVAKAFGKEIPFLDPVLKVALGVLKTFNKPKESAAEVPPAPLVPPTGLDNKVVDINSLKPPEGK